MKTAPIVALVALSVMSNVYANSPVRHAKLEMDEKNGLNGIGTTIPFELQAIQNHLPGYQVAEASGHEGSIISIDAGGESLAAILDSGNGYNKIVVYSNKVPVKVTGRIGESLENMFFGTDEATYREFCEAAGDGNIRCYARTASRDKTKHIQHMYTGSYPADFPIPENEVPSLSIAKRFKISETVWSSNASEKATGVPGALYFNIKTMKWHDDTGVCNTCTPDNGFPIPPIKDGFYFNSETKKWHDNHGPCNTCTPENGFPDKPVN